MLGLTCMCVVIPLLSFLRCCIHVSVLIGYRGSDSLVVSPVLYCSCDNNFFICVCECVCLLSCNI